MVLVVMVGCPFRFIFVSHFFVGRLGSFYFFGGGEFAFRSEEHFVPVSFPVARCSLRLCWDLFC